MNGKICKLHKMQHSVWDGHLEQAISDQLLFECVSDRLLEKMLAENIELSKYIEAATVIETTQLQMAEFLPVTQAQELYRVQSGDSVRSCYRCSQKENHHKCHCGTTYKFVRSGNRCHTP